MKKTIIRAYYEIITKELKERGLIKVVPVLKLCDAVTYYGQFEEKKTTSFYPKHKTTIEYSIKISKVAHNYYLYPHWRKREYECLIDTICHELAHMKVKNHNNEHKELTKKYMKIAKEIL